MIPIRLRLSGFLSYRDPAELDFSGFDLACISGVNGAGKSSLLDAITWALFGEARRRDDAIINSHAATAEVVFDFSYENSVYQVQRIKPRTKTTVLEFRVQAPDGAWKVLTEKSVRDTEAHIRETLRLDFETFTNASFFLQGKADQFAQQNPGDRKRILGSILGLEVWETYRENTARRLRGVQAENAVIEGQIQEVNEELAQENTRRTLLKQLEDGLQQQSALRQAKESALESLRQRAAALEEQRRLVELLAGQQQAASQRYEAVAQREQTCREEVESLRKRIASADEIEAAYLAWQQARKQLQHWEELAASHHALEQKLQAPRLAVENERARLQTEQLALVEQKNGAEAARQRAAGLEEQVKKLEAGLAEKVEQLAGRAALEAALTALVTEMAGLESDNRTRKTAMTELDERIGSLETAGGADCPLCGQPLGSQERADLVAHLQAEGKALGDAYRSSVERHKQVKVERQQAEASLAALKTMETEVQAGQRALDQEVHEKTHLQESLVLWEQNGAPRLKEIETALAGEAFLPEERGRLAQAQAEMDTLGYDPAAHEAARQQEREGQASESLKQELEAAINRLKPLEDELKRLVEQAAGAKKEAADGEAAHKAARQKLEQAAADLPDLLAAEAEVRTLKEQENHLRMQVGGARQQVEVLETTRKRQADLNERRQTGQRQVASLKALEHAFSKDGVPALLIEQALPQIETEANAFLDRLSAGAMSVHFETQKGYKDKNREDRRETLDIVISDAAGQREYEMFSGGEAFRINFAIRLALSRMLAQRAGARLQTLVVDEGFGSQDAEGRQRLIETINEIRTDFSKILIITHMEELKDAFPARIEVEKTITGSQLRVAA